MNFEPYIAYKELVKAREKAKNFKRVKFKDRILTLTRSKPNPKFGGYFVSPDGAADNDGRSYLTPITPAQFKKIILKDWDKVYFERGHIYNNFTRTVTTNNNTFGSYGSGADPKFYGSDSFIAATWTSETGGYYSTPLASAPKWVFNPAGEAARQGQSDWIPTTAGTPGTPTRTFDTAILNPFNTVQSLVNCKARFKEFNFRMSYEYTIGAYDSGTGVVTYDVNVVGASVGYPMKLYGQKQFATLEGDWWYDTAGAKLWIKTASDPTGLDWRVCTENYGFYLNQATSTTITGLDITQYYRAGIESLRATGTTVTANIHDIRSNGLWWYGNCTGMSFTGTISRCGLSGVFMGAISLATFNVTMSEIGEQGNEPWPIDTYFRKHSGQGVACSDDVNEVNKLPSGITVNGSFSDIANIGIAPYGDNWLIEHCIITRWASRFDDSGGIHPFYSNALGAGLSTKNGVIRDCICHGGIGSSEGIVGYNQLSLICGIYFDSGTENWEIDGCSCYDNPQCGLLVNFNGHGSNVHDSFFANNRGQLGQVLYYEIPDVGNSPNFLRNQNNTFNNNTVVFGSGQVAFVTASDGSGSDAAYNPFVGGSNNNNTYFGLCKTHTTTSNPAALNRLAKHGASVTDFGSVLPSSTYTNIALATWQTRTSGDAASTSTGFTLDEFGMTDDPPQMVVLGNPTGSSVLMDLTDGLYNNIAGSPIDDATVPAWSAVAAVIRPSYYYFMDSFTGTSGASIAGRTPTIGPNNANVITGTHTINNGGDMASSVAGLVSWDIAQTNYVFESFAYVTNVASTMRFDFRYADNTSSTTNRIVLRFTGGVIRLDNELGGSGLVPCGGTASAAFTLVINTTYRVLVTLNGANLTVTVNGVLYLTATTTVTTGNWFAVFGDTTRFTNVMAAYPL